MTYTIGKAFTFAAAHHLPDLPPDHKCHRVHGHNYVVTVELETEALDRKGFVIDYGELHPFKRYLDDRLDHRDLNDVYEFAPTAESLAYVLFQVAVGMFGDPVVAVTVEETPSTYATYRP